MKKVLIASDLDALLDRDSTFLSRRDISVFTAATNDEALHIHHTQRVNLIITKLAMPGMDTERFCAAIREDAGLRTVSLIMICDNSPAAIERSSRCRANAVLLSPVHPVLLMAKAQQLLNIAARETLRVLLSVNVDSRAENAPFYCRTVNISATGMLIETETPLAEGARLSCQFYLPNAKKIQASVKVIRTILASPGDEEYRYGLMFTDIAHESKRLLTEYVEKTLRADTPGGT